MRVIRKVGRHVLYFEPLQKMYAVSDDIDTSLWFDSHTKDELMGLPDNEFVEECENILG